MTVQPIGLQAKDIVKKRAALVQLRQAQDEPAERLLFNLFGRIGL